MTPERWRRVRALFALALERPPETRHAWLQTVSADDAVRAEAERLLAAHDHPLPILDASPAQVADALARLPAVAVAGQRIGPYTLVRELGRGGMGVVYLAEREDMGLRVALTLVRGAPAALAAPDHVERFLQERRLLARLEHPHIARLLDGGIAADGTHWLAMELVDGDRITDFCDRRRLGIPERLTLFRKVCDAVAYAHRNLVVHRDLKPANIMVVQVAGVGEPKLLDFGIAKLLGDDGPAGATTCSGQRPLTPEYAAPEQVLGEPVTTATDVYALGLVLYALLSGHRPYRLDGPGAAGVVQAICEARPPRPSVALGRSEIVPGPDGTDAAVGLDEVSRARGTTPGRLRRILAGDLDTVVMKALDKDPNRRYPSAAALAEDLSRFRAGLPVLARRPTQAYRARKFIRRHRSAVAGAALAVLSLTAGLGAATWQMGEARRERDRAERALAESEQVRAFLAGLFDAERPRTGRQAARTLDELLEQGVRRARALESQPMVQAQVLAEIGQVYQQRGEYRRAEEVFRQVHDIRRGELGGEAPPVADALKRLGDAVRVQGRIPEAERLYLQALVILRNSTGERDTAFVGTLVRLGAVYTHRGELDRARRTFERVLELRRSTLGEHPQVAEATRLVAVTLRRQGRYAEATARYRESLDLQRRIHGGESAEAAWAMVHLGDQYLSHDPDTTRASALLEDALRILRLRLGDDHPDLLHALHSVAASRAARGAPHEAEQLYRESLELTRRVYGPENWRTAAEIDILGGFLRTRGRYQEAERAHREALALFSALFHDGHRLPLSSRVSLTELFLARGDAAEAEAMARQILALRRRAEGAQHFMVALDLERLGRTLVAQGKLTQAGIQYQHALDVMAASHSDRHQDVQRVLRRLVDLLESRQRPEEAARYRARLAAAEDA